MTYKILETRQLNEILYTTVEYNFDGDIVQVDVAHSSPRSVEEIEENIKLRATTELYRKQAASQISDIVLDLPIAIEKPI